MEETIQPIRDFLSQVDKALSTRKLYPPKSPPYEEAGTKLFEYLKQAVGREGFTLNVTAADLLLGKTSVLHRDKREDSFFFPLYRDGLRELGFLPDATLEEIKKLLDTFQAQSKKLIGASQDTVSFLWRCDMHGITFKAIDGIGDEEGEGMGTSAQDDYQALVSDVMSKIKDPAPAESGQQYSFRVDADMQIAATDMHYEGTTARRTFDENPTVLQLSTQEAEQIRREVNRDTEEDLLNRFIDILFIMLEDPAGRVSSEALIPVCKQFLDGFWKAQAYPHVIPLLTRLKTTADSAPLPEMRESVQKALDEFLTVALVHESMKLVRSGSLSIKDAETLWAVAGGDVFKPLVEFSAPLPEGPVRSGLSEFLKGRLINNRNLLSETLSSSEPQQIRFGLSLIDESLEETYQKELFGLASHPDESIRRKGLAAAGRIGNQAAFDVLFNAMQNDPESSVRLLAFRLIGTMNVPQLPKRLKTLVMAREFGSRPLWEREKYVRLLGSVAGESTRSLFESWIPHKTWFWQRRDHEKTALALEGLVACGDTGRERVQTLVTTGGKVGTIAQTVLMKAPKKSTTRKTTTSSPQEEPDPKAVPKADGRNGASE